MAALIWAADLDAGQLPIEQDRDFLGRGRREIAKVLGADDYLPAEYLRTILDHDLEIVAVSGCVSNAQSRAARRLELLVLPRC